MMRPSPLRQFNNLLFFQDLAIGNILMRGVLLHVVDGAKRIIASCIVDVPRKLHRAGVEFRMTVQPHASVHLDDYGVELVQGHEVGHEPFEERNVVAARQKEIDPAKWLVGPVSYFSTSVSFPPLSSNCRRDGKP